MTDKQIIIDGFNLEYIKGLLYNGQRSAITTKIFEEIIEKLERKEQECEELKKIINEAKNSKLDLKSFLVGEAVQNEYEQQLDQLKAENEELKKFFNEGCLHNLTLMTEQRVLLQTLAEIKEIAEDFGFNGIYEDCFTGIQKILQKISECEVE